jgi:hypothetical protein
MKPHLCSIVNNPSHYINGATAGNWYLQTKQTITILETPVHNGLSDDNKYIPEHECLKLMNSTYYSPNKTVFKCKRNTTFWVWNVCPSILWYSLCSSNPIPTSTLVCCVSHSLARATLKSNSWIYLWLHAYVYCMYVCFFYMKNTYKLTMHISKL